MRKVTRYILIGYSNPNLKTSKADIKVYARNYYIGYFWCNTCEIDCNTEYVMFDTRFEAEKFIKKTGFENVISYGIDVDTNYD